MGVGVCERERVATAERVPETDAELRENREEVGVQVAVAVSAGVEVGVCVSVRAAERDGDVVQDAEGVQDTDAEYRGVNEEVGEVESL